jgi:hypothetical protein
VQCEIAHERLDADRRVTLREPVGRLAQGALRHVDRHETPELTGRRERVEQKPRLVARAAAQLDERRGVAGGDDVVSVVAQDRPLALGRVVLGKARDLVESAEPTSS